MALCARCLQAILSQFGIQDTKGDRKTNGTVSWAKWKGSDKGSRR
jgi:hypothetical protein